MGYSAEIFTVLTKVCDIVFNLAASAEIKSIHNRCLEDQGRPLNVMDLEHVLCKIARQVSVMRMDTEEKAVKKAAREEKKAKGEGGKKPKPREEGNLQQSSSAMIHHRQHANFKKEDSQ